MKIKNIYKSILEQVSVFDDFFILVVVEVICADLGVIGEDIEV